MTARRVAVAVVLSASALGLALSPRAELADRALAAATWAIPLIAISEVLLTIGILGMLSSAGASGWCGIAKARQTAAGIDWPAVAADIDRRSWFWFFWTVSLVGGMGDGIVLITAIGTALPPASWGVMLLPFADVVFTISIRTAIRRAVRLAAAGRPVSIVE